ncbi:tRNA (adenosine(37)-N6)-threonylcarbamoyltransferase complex ATPase subunit type 1 TsaE [bacterium]|nr:MAG: tRNA (adenosine(37)-N6)-threonylcarbamoyltransferase complex ATPase subunit type 1 TsaE [bacterium]
MKLISISAEKTISLGRSIAKRLNQGDIICLFGELGSGKTVFAKGVACGLKIPQQQVISPTFVLIRQYNQGRLPLYHFDLYRLELPKDILVLGYEEYFYGQGVSIIEWPERLEQLIPKEYLRIDLKIISFNKRLFRFSCQGKRYKELLGEINEDIRH